MLRRRNSPSSAGAPAGENLVTRRAALAISAAVFVAAATVGMVHARDRLVASAPYADALVQVELEACPPWMPGEHFAAVREALQEVAEGRTLLDEHLVGDVYAAARTQPWIKKVRRVTKRHDGSVRVEADFRRVFALAAHRPGRGGEQVRVIDEEGVVLPLTPDWVVPDTVATVVGVEAPPAAPGEPWPGQDLADGLRMLKLVESKPYVRLIRHIDVRNHHGRIYQHDPHLCYVAAASQQPTTVIRFGRFPAADGLDHENTPAGKIAMLDEHYVRFRTILSDRGVIDLRYDQLCLSAERP